MSKRKEKEDIKMTIFIMVAGIALMVLGVFGIVTSRIERKNMQPQLIYGKFPLLLLTFQPTIVRMTMAM